MNSVWDVLEIPRGSDRDAIRSAYAKKLRITNPEDDPEGFKRLRAAYEAALQQHDYAVRWADYEETIDDEDVGGDATNEPVGDWDQPAGDRRDDPTQDTAESEIDAMLAAREAELEALRAAMAELEAGLRGPWRPDDAVLEERLTALLRSPAMAEIRIRTDVEPWLAELLAATIPHSDAVLMQSIQAFGWGADQHHSRGTSHAVALVLGRFEEWRIIAGLNDPSHAYHAAWRSLTRPPGSWWSWRLNAFRPAVIDGVATLLGEHGEVAPGLHYSFSAESVDRWRRFLAKPRLTLGMLALMPVAFLALLGLAGVAAGTDAVPPAWVIAGSAAIGLATPAAVLFGLAGWRRRWRERYDHARWQRQGWLAAHALLAFGTMALPRPDWPALVIVPAIAIAVWAYVSIPRSEPQPLRLGVGVATYLAAAFLSTAMLDQLVPSEQFALATMVALLVYLRLAAWPAVRTVLEELTWRHREWIVLGGVVAGLGLAFGIAWLRMPWQPVLPLYIVSLAGTALLPLVGPLAPGQGGPPRWIARALLILAFAWAYGASVPPRHDAARPRSNGVPMIEGRQTVDDLMTEIERRQAGFRQMREGNPPLYASIRGIMGRYSWNALNRDEANAAIATLINDAYRRMAPDADSALLVEGMRIRLERQRALRGIDPAACVSGGAPKASLPEALRQRETAQIYNVVTNPPASPAQIAAGRPISNATLSASVAKLLKADQPTLIDQLRGKHGPAAACEVRIAITQAMLDQRLDDIAATLRKELREIRDKPSPPAQEKTGGREVQPPV